MKRKIIAIISTLLLFLLISCADGASYQKITPQEAMEIMTAKESYVLLDVRSESEYAEQHIEGALLLPGPELQSRVENVIPDKNTLIFVYCRSGQRSAQAARLLVSLGYTNVYDIGGIQTWPYGTVR